MTPDAPLPPLDALRAGHRLPAGLGAATVLPDHDFETYSEAGFCWTGAKWAKPEGAPPQKKGLGIVGAAVYAKHPSTRVLSYAYDLKDGAGRRHWRPGLPEPLDLFAHVRAGGLLEAWNTGFERWIWEEVCVKRMGWPPVLPWQWRCCMAKARAHSLPGALDEAGRVLALRVQKDADGKRLLDKFSMPRNPTQADPRTRIAPLWTQLDVDETLADLTVGLKGAKLRDATALIVGDIDDTQRLARYNLTDIESEAEASSVIPDLSPSELRFWQDDQEINHRGVRIDMESVHNCIAIIEQAGRRYGDELATITGGIKPTEGKQLIGWLHGLGVHTDSLDEEHVEDLLKQALPPVARRALEIRAAMASASVKKVFALRNQTTAEGRLHDMYVFHGTHTGRPTGSGVQSTNLPKAGPNVYRCGYDMAGAKGKPLPGGGCGRHHGAHTLTCHWCSRFTLRGPKDAGEWCPEAMMDALEAIGHRSLDWLEALFGDALLTVAGVLRGLFIAAPGHDLVSSDFTAIEGVIVACLAGEQWRIDAYANDEPMYLLSAERMFGVPVAEMKAYAKANGHHHPLRQKGKGGELGLGFGGWIAALRQFDVDGPDDELKETVLKWRAASPAIEWLWGGQFKGPADSILVNAGRLGYADRWDKTPFRFGLEGAAINAVENPGLRFEVERLDGKPTGIAYLMRGDALYCRVPSGGIITYHRPRLRAADQEWRGLSLSYEGWNTNPKNGPIGWITKSLYGGRSAENVTQKVARDKQMGAIARCHDNGYLVVMHTYDEIVAEVPVGFGSVEGLEGLMTTPEPWNAGWPLKAAGGWRGTRYRKA